MKYRITFSVDASVTVDVEAGSESEAREKAGEIADPCLCHQCANQVEMGEIQYVISTEELK